MKKELTKRELQDIRILAQFVGIYCNAHHGDDGQVPFDFKVLGAETLLKKQIDLCPQCTKLLRYGLTMRLRCPHDPKPMCKKCPNPCYKPEYREEIREVMKFSGIYLVKHGRIDLLYHYFR